MASRMDRGQNAPSRLVHALAQVPVLQELGGRNSVVRALSVELDTRLPVVEDRRTMLHLWSIVDVCQRRPDGLLSLLYVLESIEPGAKQMDEVRRLINQKTTLDMWHDEERDRLFALLVGVVVPDIADVYRSVGGTFAPPLPPDAANHEFFLALETLNADPDGLPKPLVFIEHLTARVRSDLSAELRGWADRQADLLGLTAELRAARGKGTRPVQPHPPPHAPAYLVMQIQLDGPTGQRHRLTPWKQLDVSDGWHPERGEDFVGDLGEIRNHVAALVEKTEAEWAGYDPAFHIEFVLSNELLNLDVDQWPWEIESPFPEPLGCRFTIAVRPLSRMTSRKWHRTWRHRWMALTAQLGGSGVIPEEAGHCSDGKLEELSASLELNRNLLSLIPSQPPAANSIGAHEVHIGLRAGIPLMVWHRQDCAAEDFLLTARKLLHGSDGDEVLERARLVRASAVAAGRNSNHVGRNLTVLWDDPERTITPLHAGPPQEG